LNTGFEELENEVIHRGLCTICGTCIGVCPNKSLKLFYDNEEPLPTLEGKCSSCGICYSVCPGKDVPLLELEKFIFGKIRENRPDDLGIVIYSGMGYATDENIRQAGTSGGMTTAILKYALDAGIIDCALVTGFSQDKPWRTEPKIVTSSEELIENAQSKYLPVAINSALSTAAESFNRIGIVGLPCHIHAIRKMQFQSLVPNISGKIKMLLGLLCGSNWYFEGTRHVLSELCGVKNLNDISKIQCRGRDNEGSSNFIVELQNGTVRQVPKEKYILMWMSAFKRDRCLMCIDWSAELADISLGDYWSPEQFKRIEISDNNSVLARTPQGLKLLQDTHKAGYIMLKDSPQKYLFICPAYEWKKHGSIHHLSQRQRYGWPTPDFHCHLSHDPY
jgi:coenzyme F420 hydrogenase subunit beta